MWCRVELPDVEDIALVLQDSGFVVVDIEVVRGAEDGHDAGEAGSSGLAVHAITSILSFVGSDDREEVVLFEEVTGSRVGEEV